MEVFELSVSNYSKLLNSQQIQAVSRVLSMIKKGEEKIYVLGSSGSGKTTMSIFLSEVLYGKNRNKKILFLHYNKILNQQLFQRLTQSYSTEEVTTDLKGNGFEKPGFYITTWHQIGNRLDEIDKDFDYVIADEFQDFSDERSKLYNYFNGRIITFGEVPIDNYNSVIPIFSVGTIRADHYSEKEIIKLKEQLDFYKNELKERDRENLLLHEKNQALMLERESSTKKMLEILEQVTLKVDRGFAGVNEKLDELKSTLDSINNILHNLQDQYKVKLLTTSEEKEHENLIHQFSEDFMEVLLRKFKVSTQAGYIKEKDKLLSIFGSVNWGKLTDESKQYIITSNILFNNMADYEHQVDYSPVCIPLTKALERELYIHFFSGLVDDLRKRKIPIQEWPDGLSGYNHQQKKYHEIPNHKFTLGSIPYIIGTRLDPKRPKRVKSNREVIMPYFFERLTIANESEIWVYLNKLDKGVQYVTVNYRNQAAHKDKIGLEHALSCYNYLIKVTALLVELSRYLKV